MADLATLKDYFNQAAAAHDDVAAQQFHDAIVRMQAQPAAPDANVAPAANDSYSGLLAGGLANGALAPDAAPVSPLAPLGTSAGRTAAGQAFTSSFSDEGQGLANYFRALIGNQDASQNPPVLPEGMRTPHDFVAAERARQNAVMAADPTNAAAGTVLGLVGTLPLAAVGGAEVAAGKTFMQAAPKLAATGGAWGGVGAAGASPADIINDPLSFLSDTGKGVALGTALGAGIPAVATAIGKSWSWLSTLARELRGKPEAVIKMNAERIRKELLARGYTEADLQAEFDKNNALVVGDMTPKLSSEMAAATVGNAPGSRDLLKAISQRDAAVRERATPVLKDIIGVPQNGPTFIDQGNLISQAKVAETKPLYQQAETVPMHETDTMNILMRNSKVAGAYNGAVQRAKDEMITRAAQDLQQTGKFPVFGIDEPPPIVVHQMALAKLSDQVGAAAKAGEFNTMRELMGVKSTLRNEIERQNPAFAQAQKIWAGHSADEAALETGRNVFKYLHTWDQLQEDVLNKFSVSEKAQFNIGVMRAIDDKLSSTSNRGNEIDALLRTPNAIDLFSTVLGHSQAKVDQLRTLLATEQSMYNSFSRARAMQDLAEMPNATGAAKAAQAGGMIGTAGGIIIPHAGTAGVPFAGRLAGAALGRKLFSTREEAARRLIGQQLFTRQVPSLAPPPSGLLSPAAAATGAGAGLLAGSSLADKLGLLQ